MGKMIENIAKERKHQTVLIIDVNNLSDFTKENIQKAHVVIEFTNPETAFENITRCIKYGVPVVSGTTGWHSRLEEAKELCSAHNGSMICTTNFSIGVNIVFEINRQLAKIINHFPDYTLDIEETHHIQKLDAPSGTAITLAEGAINEITRIKKWELDGEKNFETLPIRAIRKDEVPGTHRIKYSSPVDDIEITHTAHNRKGLALGAVLAAEYIHNRKGIFTMKDILKI